LVLNVSTFISSEKKMRPNILDLLSARYTPTSVQRNESLHTNFWVYVPTSIYCTQYWHDRLIKPFCKAGY
jgi:hypothetical protein